ncbi:hypothetical protein PA598K_00452 [Paenibacillus sp. 598K]|uniref:FAD binding domain-containing protein n=1 Tax=Paenibacillus sp. 598K TaxID=1117987 RepID=UPI000FF9172E|nr:FAD binding domain-containing protein [Paenibacillus sp. 598K]GBF72214.1 hypothetical protein PA598K_00452 [Paenibacillus sp. 598K]
MHKEALRLAGEPHIALPTSLADARRQKRRLGEGACYGAGTTLLRTQWEQRTRAVPRRLISLQAIPELSGIRRAEDGGIEIGAMTTLGLCRADPEVRSLSGLFVEAIGSVAAPAVRNLATLGGNVCSLTGDVVPALLALEAELTVDRRSGPVRVGLQRWLAEAAGRDGEDILCRIHLPPPCAEAGDDDAVSLSRYVKLGRRAAFTPSLVTVALAGRMRAEDGVILGVRIALGGGTALPQRLTAAERLLEGHTLDTRVVEQVGAAVRTHYTAATDRYADAGYRREAAANLVMAQLWSLIRR